MSLPEAPLFTRTYALCRYLLERTARFPKDQRFVLAKQLTDAAFALVHHVMVALRDLEERAGRLAEADAALAQVELAVMLAGDLELLRPNQLDYLQREIAEVGRMLGGWRRKLRASHAGPVARYNRGGTAGASGGARAAPSPGRCAAAPGRMTIRGTCACPAATGTRLRIATTTSASGWPPPRGRPRVGPGFPRTGLRGPLRRSAPRGVQAAPEPPAAAHPARPFW